MQPFGNPNLLIIMRVRKRVSKLNMPLVGSRQGKWTESEHCAMFRFVEYYRDCIVEYMESNLIKKVRSNKRAFFTNMAAYIGSKTDVQCKSRYQKQEVSLLRALDLPDHLLKAFYKSRSMTLATAKKVEHVLSSYATETTLEEEKVCTDASQHESIQSGGELKNALSGDFVPQLKNQSLITQMEHLISILPDEVPRYSDVPSFCQNSISLILPQMSASYFISGVKADSFFEE